jgi:hypothetical protein
VPGERRHFVHRQGDAAHRLGKRKAREPLAREHREVPGIARRRDQADRHLGGAVSMAEPEDQALRAARARGEESRELDDQPLRSEQQRLGLDDLRGKLDRRAEPRRRNVKIPRIGEPSERPVERVEQPLAEAPRHALARQLEKAPEGAHADRRQRLQALAVAAQDRDGQRGERRRLGGLQEPLDSRERQPERGARRGRAREPRAPAHVGQIPAQAPEKRRKSAEEPEAARGVEQYRVGKLERDARGELRRPPGQPEQRLGLRGGVAMRDAQAGRDGERRRDGHAGAHAALARLAVAGEDAVPLFER